MPMSPRYLRALLAVLPLLIAPAVRGAPDVTDKPRAAAERATEPAKFMRFVDDGHAGGRLESAAVTYRNKDGVTVRLVGAVHIGEKSYFESLNKSFENDDAVLYELVKPKGVDVPQPGQKSDNPISQFQHMLKDVLNLDFQLDDIDYGKPNFVHADMDAETFRKMQEDRGETFEMLMLRQLMKAFTHPDDADEKKDAEPEISGDKMIEGLIEMLTRPDMERQLKVTVARQLDKMQDSAMGLDGPGGSVILTERNKVALKILQDTMAAGKKKISIFYGAAHMPDLAKRVREMGFEPVATDWNTAWDLTIRQDQPSGAERLLKELFRALEDE